MKKMKKMKKNLQFSNILLFWTAQEINLLKEIINFNKKTESLLP